ncbi:hypothetical protein HSTV1_16 [Haloarcula sinaiiensis tailed virus 1]|uniref:Uncharacterized protein n=1 Tax=Haloarcula sinaiiensis tailed virus 1 TaxID=1262530 RepID=R9QSS5_9CAUD|nr:hypothetical protein HSTV1_16 [Haloarcula sinaiiensis tailed virus 1]AGC34561.1 hypothetical protein HSTV1_16 [Haloarcula sinaiiensis tailed virus 1]
MPEDTDGNTADGASERWPYTNDVLAIALVVGTIKLTFWFVVDDEAIPLWLAGSISLALTTAVAWAFGSKAFAAAKDAVKNE